MVEAVIATASQFLIQVPIHVCISPMGVVAYLVYNGLYSALGNSTIFNLIALVAAVAAGALVYLVLCYLFKIDQVRNVTDKVLQRLNRK